MNRPKLGSLRCSYCHSEMRLATVQVKRPVPLGATDLALYDTRCCFQCPQCGLTQAREVVQDGACHCGEITIQKRYALSLQDMPVRLLPEMSSYSALTKQGGVNIYAHPLCTNCATCIVCEEIIGTQEYAWDEIRRPNADEEDDGYRRYVYYHAWCTEGRKKQRQEQRDMARERAEERRQALASVMAKRRQEGQCLDCGEPLSLFDKVCKRQTHRDCALASSLFSDSIA